MIKIYKEVNLTNFDTWAGASDTVKHLTHDQLEEIQEYITEIYPNGLTETELNDFLWFERDLIAEILGYETFDDLIE